MGEHGPSDGHLQQEPRASRRAREGAEPSSSSATALPWSLPGDSPRVLSPLLYRLCQPLSALLLLLSSERSKDLKIQTIQAMALI